MCVCVRVCVYVFCTSTFCKQFVVVAIVVVVVAAVLVAAAAAAVRMCCACTFCKQLL